MPIQELVKFGTDGIRGIAGTYPLDPATVLRIGRSLAMWACRFPDPKIIVGRDTRVSGHMISYAMIAGLLSESAAVTNIGEISTPGMAFLTKLRGATLGIMISASHNPYEQNGIKLFGADGFKLNDEAEADIETLIAGMDMFRPAPNPGNCEWADLHASHQYLYSLSTTFTSATLAGFKVVLDCANGSASHIAPIAFREEGAEITAIKAAPNGTNINQSAGSEFVRRDRSALLSAVQGYEADLGIAFDGDADRVVFVTPDGMLIDGDHLLGILAVQFKAAGKLPGNTVVATEMSNSGLEVYLAQNGIKLERTKVGDRFVMERMRAGGFTLGGEQAGHIIILDGGRTCGDGIYVGMLISALMVQSKKENGPTLSQLAQQIPRYPQVIANAHLTRKIDLRTITALQPAIQATLDAFGGKGRVNIRFSGTEPNLLRAMVEGGPANTLADVVARAVALCMVVAGAAQSPEPVIDVIDCMTGASVQLS